MATKIKYDKKKDNKTSLISSQKAKGEALLEEHNHLDGDYLIFGTPPLPSVKERLASIEARLTALEKKP